MTYRSLSDGLHTLLACVVRVQAGNRIQCRSQIIAVLRGEGPRVGNVARDGQGGVRRLPVTATLAGLRSRSAPAKAGQAGCQTGAARPPLKR